MGVNELISLQLPQSATKTAGEISTGHVLKPNLMLGLQCH